MLALRVARAGWRALTGVNFGWELEAPLVEAKCLCPLRWITGGIGGSTCRQVPSREGTCGLYSVKQEEIEGCLLEEGGVIVHTKRGGVLQGDALLLVEALGRTIHHDNGVLRSQKQLIRKIWLPELYWDRAERYSELYQCEVVIARIGYLKGDICD